MGGGVTAPGTVRVERVAGADGRTAWIVDIPGTHRWSPVAGTDPFDLTSDVATLAGRPSAAGATVVQALRHAGARPGEPVLLAGHSLGGMVAAQLAADPAVRREFHITHVVTAGSPIALADIPGTIHVLSLEHDDDLVPRLDGAVNPDRSGWVTVSRPVTALGGNTSGGPSGGSSADLAGSAGGDTHPRLVVTHDGDTYAGTAALVDASSDPSLVAWRGGLGAFLARPGATATVTEVVGERLC
jgi:pimeloyl-ACP methyl ester carboxylesterase